MMCHFTWQRGLLLIGVLALLGLGGCKRSAKAPIVLSPEHVALRAQYAESHPDDPFLDTIATQEILKGMTPTQVYLSWGRPVHRIKGADEQKWIYEFTEDPEVQPKKVAHLFFERGLLVRWFVDRSYIFLLDPESGSGGADDFRDLPDLRGSKQPGN